MVKSKIDELINNIVHCNPSIYTCINKKVYPSKLGGNTIELNISPNPNYIYDYYYKIHTIKTHKELDDYFIEAYNKAKPLFYNTEHCGVYVKAGRRMKYIQNCSYTINSINSVNKDTEEDNNIRLNWCLYFPCNSKTLLFCEGGGKLPYEHKFFSYTYGPGDTNLYKTYNYEPILLEHNVVKGLESTNFKDYYVPLFYLQANYDPVRKVDFNLIRLIESSGDFKVVFVKLLHNDSSGKGLYYFYSYIKRNTVVDKVGVFGEKIGLTQNLLRDITSKLDTWNVR